MTTPDVLPVHRYRPYRLTTNQERRAASCIYHRGELVNFGSQNRREDARAGNSLFVRMLWAAFPSPSEKKLAERAAPVLGVTERQVQNWLLGKNDGKTAHLERLVLLVGVEKFAQFLEGKKR